MGIRGVWRVDLGGSGGGDRSTVGRTPGPTALDVEADITPGATVGDLARQLANHVARSGLVPHGWLSTDPDGTDPDDTDPDDTDPDDTDPDDTDDTDPDSSGRDGDQGDHGGARLTLRCDDVVVDPDETAASAAPRNGSTVRIVCVGPRHAPEAVAAPVVVRGPEGPIRLHYGTNDLSPGVSASVGNTVRLNDEGAGNVTVNGIAVRGNRVLEGGDLVRSGGWTATLEVTGVLRPPPSGGPTVPVALSRGAWEDHGSDPVDLPHPPGRFRSPGFPWLTAAVPLLMAAGAWAVTRSLMLVAFMGFSFVYVIASGIESKLESRAADRSAVAEFREALVEAEQVLAERRRDQLRRDETHHPSTDETTGWVSPPSHRLWERHGAHPQPLVVRLGTVPRGPDDPAVRPERGRPDLREELDAACSHNDPAPRPLTLDLARSGGLAIVGDDATTIEFACALVAQLTVLSPPGRLEVDVDDADGRWDWVDWTPHTASGGDDLLLVEHRDRGSGARRTGTPGATRTARTIMVWIAPDTIGLPESIRAVVQFDNHGIATQQLDHRPPVEFTPEFTERGGLEVLARRLAGLEPGTAGTDPGRGSIPARVSLSQLGVPMRPDGLRTCWQRHAGTGGTGGATGAAGDATRAGVGLEFALGAVAGGGILTLDLVRDGPHALVAGTTGSGKSELLRTMVLGLASRHSPQRLNFFLVDYKGGAAFGPLAEIPHCVGLLTDLRSNGADRTLTALRAELRRRESVLDRHGASDAREVAVEDRPASLVVVIDEFATLVAEVPEFLEGMLDVAQRGRSLGIHMVLATQRPTGVITDAIRANTALRIALRLPDADDSDDVIDSPKAAVLPRDVAGRALVRLGHDELVPVQVAYSGADPMLRPAVEVRALGRRRPWGLQEHRRAAGDPPPGPSELESVIDAMRRAVSGHSGPRIHHPVPPPLPQVVGFGDMPTRCPERPGAGRLLLGLVDRPENQRVEPLLADPGRLGGILVLGAPASGVSSALKTVAQAVTRHGGWAVHAIDATGGLADLASVSPGSEVVDAADHEPLRRMLTRLAANPTVDEAPRHLLLVDGFAAFEALQDSVNRGWATEQVLELAREGGRHGVLVAVAARRRMEVPPSLMHHLGERIVLRVVDGDEASLVDAPPGLADVDLPPGRAWVRGSWAQLVLPTPLSVQTETQPPPRLPSTVTSGGVRKLADSATVRGWRLPIGIDAEDLRAAVLDLTGTHALVTGSPGAGCTSALDTIACAAEHAGIEVLRPVGAASAVESLERAAGAGADQRHLVILEDLERRADDPGISETLAAILDGPRDSPVRVVGAGDPIGLMRCYDDSVLRMRAMRTGLLLGAEAHAIGDVLHHDLRSRDDIPSAPGRGWLVRRSGATIIQVAFGN